LPLKFEVVVFDHRASRKGRFPRKAGGLSKRVGNFTYGEMYLLAKSFDILNSLINSFETRSLLSNFHPFFLKILFKFGARLKF